MRFIVGIVRLLSRRRVWWEQRGIERAAQWHDRIAEQAELDDRLAVACFHRQAAFELRRL